ncbi:hypothetical protein MASR2M39_32180 [Ignavibacteriales bacterium]
MINKKSFLINYIIRLKERTRNEKSGTVFGFDWVMYNLFLVQGWTAIELPFLLSGNQKGFKTKTHPQFGVDMAFLKNRDLIVLVLKDESLTYKNWTKHNFSDDLQMAAFPDSKIIKEYKIKSQRIILAYNKYEDKDGVKQFENVVNGLKQNTIKNTSFERWNITKIVDEVENHLLTPELLPQYLSAQLSFMCQLIQRVEFGSKEWEQLLIPSWKLYLDNVIGEKIDLTHLHMIPISLVIIDQFRERTNPNSYLGFIELMEWAVITAFHKVKIDQKKEFIIVWSELWGNLYLFELSNFLVSNEKLFYVEHGLSRGSQGGLLAPLNDAYLVYWYISKVSICYLGYNEIKPQNDEEKDAIEQILKKCREWLKNLIRLNPGAYRPLIDLNHIEIYLIWVVLTDSSDNAFISDFFSVLQINLLIRKLGKTNIPFIEGGNRYDLVAEYFVSPEPLRKNMVDFIDNSSYLILMVLELIQSIHGQEMSGLLKRYWHEIVLAQDTGGVPFGEGFKSLSLQSVAPVKDWSKNIFSESDQKVITILFHNNEEIEPSAIQESLLSFIKKCTTEFPNTLQLNHPLGSYILACIKHKSPLPPYFWRRFIFPNFFNDGEKSSI